MILFVIFAVALFPIITFWTFNNKYKVPLTITFAVLAVITSYVCIKGGAI